MALEHAPSQIVGRLLAEMGLGATPQSNTTVTWPIYINNEPPSPDNTITIYDTPGSDDGRVMAGELQQHYGFQVRVRSAVHNTGWSKISNIRKEMAENAMAYQHVVTIESPSTRYLVHAITGIGQVIPLGKETPESKRDIFTLNASVVVYKITE